MTRPGGIRRRTLVKGISASSLIPLLGSNLIGCSDSSDRRRDPPTESVPADFLHGVASGDPLQDRVILWTRVTPEQDGNVVVEWEIASDEAFDSIINGGSGSTDAKVDYTVKVDVEGLDPATVYYYRFRTGDKVSAVGRTRTVPTGALTTATFAVVSCSNYPAGFFHVYREIASREVDVVLHLGDYIYEYGPGGYDTGRAEEIDRTPEPSAEIVSLGDYRTRYAQYRSDDDLQACHGTHPFIIVWDDHEVANNAWRDGAENHDPDTEGSFSERRAAAIQAWYEWLPVRPPASEEDIIYRRFQYGDLVDLLMLDTRHVGRDEQINYADFLAGGMIDVDAARAALNDSNRTLLGARQNEWLKARLTDSNARWQVLGQQVLMGRLLVPEPVARILSPDFESGGALQDATAAIIAAVAAKTRPPGERTEEEQALLDSFIPVYPDSWDGYGFEREAILNHAKQLQSRLVVLSGDSHNSWTLQLTTAEGTPVGVEFGGPSVTSSGADGVVGAELASQFESLALTLMDDLNYIDLVNRGYLTVNFTPDRVTGEYRYVSDFFSPEYEVSEGESRQISVSREDLLLT